MTDAVPLHLVVFVLATFLGALIAGVAGFAFGLIASAIWLHIITPAESAALISGYAIVVQGFAIWRLRNGLKVARLLPFIAGGAAGIPLGALLLRTASADHLRASIGLLLVLFSVYSLARPKFQLRGSGRIGDGLVGVASGIVGASTGLAGLPVIIWSTGRGWTKDEQRAVFQPVVIAIFAMNLLWFGGSGMVTKDVLQLFFMGLPAALLGTWLGLQLYGSLDEARFRRIVLLLLLISGLTLLPSAVTQGDKTDKSELPSLSPGPDKQSQAHKFTQNRSQALQAALAHQIA
jgi:uncharacterized protein